MWYLENLLTSEVPISVPESYKVPVPQDREAMYYPAPRIHSTYFLVATRTVVRYLENLLASEVSGAAVC